MIYNCEEIAAPSEPEVEDTDTLDTVTELAQVQVPGISETQYFGFTAVQDLVQVPDSGHLAARDLAQAQDSGQ